MVWGSRRGGKKKSAQATTKPRRQSRVSLEPLEDRRMLAVLYWDTNGATPGLGGSGDWDLSSANWTTDPTGSSVTQAWNNANGGEAVFTGTAGTVTVASGIAADALAFSAAGYLLQSGTLALDAGTVDVATSTSATIGSTLVGSGGFTKTGSGTLTLSGLNTFTGDLTISAGVVNAAAGQDVFNATQGALGNPQATRNIIVDSDATLRFAVHDVLGNVVSTPQAAIIVNGGTVTNAGAQFNTLGPLTLNGGALTGSGGAMGGYQMYRLAGTVTVSADAVISGSGTYSGIHLAAPTTIDVAADTTLSVSAILIDQTPSQSGPAGLVKTGAGTLTLSGLNAFSGDLTISAGVVNAAAGQNVFNATQGSLGNPQAV